jgi:hypothetical protein
MFSETNTKSNRFISRTLERPIVDLGTVSGTVALDLNDGTFFRMKLIGNINIVLSSSENASFENINLEITNENFSVNWPKEINLDSNGGQYTQLIAPYTTSTFVLTKSGKNSFAYDVTNIIQKSIKATPLRPDSSTTSTIYCKFIMDASQQPYGYWTCNFMCCCPGFSPGSYFFNQEIDNSINPQCGNGTTLISSPYTSSYTRKYHLTGRYMTSCTNSSCCICITTNLVLVTQGKDTLCSDTIYGGFMINQPCYLSITYCQWPVGIDDDKNIFFFCCATVGGAPTIYRTPNPEIVKSGVNQFNCYQMYYSTGCCCIILPSPCGSNFNWGKIAGWSDKCTFIFTTMVGGVSYGNTCCGSDGNHKSMVYRNVCPTSYPACYVNDCNCYPPLTVTNKKGYYLSMDFNPTSCCGVYTACVGVWCDNCASFPDSSPCLTCLLNVSVQGYFCGGGCCQNSNFGGATLTCDGCYLITALSGPCALGMCANGLPQTIKVFCKCASNPCFCGTPTCFSAKYPGSGNYCCLCIPTNGISAESCCYTERPLAGAYMVDATDGTYHMLCYNKANTCWMLTTSCCYTRFGTPINSVNSINSPYFTSNYSWPNWMTCGGGFNIAYYYGWMPFTANPNNGLLIGTNYPAVPAAICPGNVSFLAYDMSTPRSEDR